MNAKIATAFLSFCFLFSALLAYCSSAEQLKIKESGFYGRADKSVKTRKTKEAPLIQGKEEVLCFVSLNPYATRVGGKDFRVVIGGFETIWNQSRIDFEDKKAVIRIIVLGKKSFEFCEIPPEITEFSQIGNLAKYRLKSLTRPFFTNTMVGANRIGNDYLPKGSFPCHLKQGQIILLKDGEKYLAIKAVDFKPVYKSFDELPENVKNNYVREIYGGQEKSPPPIWKSMTYEWSFLSPDQGQSDSAIAQTETQGTSKAPFLVEETNNEGTKILKGSYFSIPYFYIPGVDSAVAFSFSKKQIDKQWKNPRGEDRHTKGDFLTIRYDIRLSLVERAWETNTINIIDDIKNPQFYVPLREIISMEKGYYIECIRGNYIDKFPPIKTIILRIDNKYVAIRPLRIENDQVVYEWKYWPEAPPTQEALIKTGS